MLKPVPRSALRLLVGKRYFTYKRYLKWLLGGVAYARQQSIKSLPHRVFRHETPLLRRLKDVDMELQYGKITNLRLAIPKLDGIILQPGETFSYWRLIGKPTQRKGYAKGMVLFYGGFKPGTGGGLCQLSNLIYWMTLHTPLIVTERHRHSYDVFPDAARTQPFGSGATCAYNYLDLQIYNPTEYPYQLKLDLTSEYLVGEWRSMEEPAYYYCVYETNHRMTQEYWGGYTRHNCIRRKTYNIANELVQDEPITENHALMMYQPFLEAGNGNEEGG